MFFGKKKTLFSARLQALSLKVRHLVHHSILTQTVDNICQATLVRDAGNYKQHQVQHKDNSIHNRGERAHAQRSNSVLLLYIHCATVCTAYIYYIILYYTEYSHEDLVSKCNTTVMIGGPVSLFIFISPGPLRFYIFFPFSCPFVWFGLV